MRLVYYGVEGGIAELSLLMNINKSFCNRLPVPYQNTTLSHLRITLFWLRISLPLLFICVPLPRVYIDALKLHL